MSLTDGRLRTALADHYRLERELGAGGMATVYLAEDLKHGRKLAIKVLHPELDVMPGDSTFLLIGEPSVGTPEDIHTVVVENYFEELKRSAP